jgi:class 3 adenylate cyclase
VRRPLAFKTGILAAYLPTWQAMNKIRALLMTDIVDSTHLAARLGDDAMSALWTEHDRQARLLLREWSGKEIDKTDGFLLIFDAASDALGFASAYHRAIGGLRHPLVARVGLHVGEVILRAGEHADVALGAKLLDVDGLAKPTAARVMALAPPGRTILSAAAAGTLEIGGPQLSKCGWWRVKGLDEPIELFGVPDAGDHDDALSLCDGAAGHRVTEKSGTWVPLREIPHSLPSERDSFVGRHTDLTEIDTHFSGGARLVSLIGIGGTGKTRLAQRFALTRLGEFDGGAWFCDLSSATSYDGVLHGVATGLGLPLDSADPASQISRSLRARGRCLVVIDNFEQVLPFAEQTLGRWLSEAPGARFVATSRIVLGIKGETPYFVGPLDAVAAATLFRARAAIARKGFATSTADDRAISQLVGLLDGLPLALELAAARIRVLSPVVLLERMSQRFKVLSSTHGRTGRQSALGTTFDWSWDLLSPAEKSGFAQLSVFGGGFSLDAIESVVDL